MVVIINKPRTNQKPKISILGGYPSSSNTDEHIVHHDAYFEEQAEIQRLKYMYKSIPPIRNKNQEDDPYETQRMFDEFKRLYKKEQVTTPPQHRQIQQQQQILDQ